MKQCGLGKPEAEEKDEKPGENAEETQNAQMKSQKKLLQMFLMPKTLRQKLLREKTESIIKITEKENKGTPAREV